MPELPEVEFYRRLAAGALGRRVAGVDCAHGYLRGEAADGAVLLRSALRRRCVEGVRRRGKVLFLDFDRGITVAVRFGMTGRLFLDGADAVGELVYSSRRLDSAWERFVLRFTGGGHLVVSDTRRLGSVELDPDEEALGPDALGISTSDLRRALSATTATVKARLMDQRRIAGIGNLICDEVLWRSSLAPTTTCDALSEADLRRLSRHLGRTLEDLLERGGSHLGDLFEARRHGGLCPREQVGAAP